MEPKATGVERHVQTIIQLIIIALLAWFGNRTMKTSDVVIRLEEQMISIRSTVTNIDNRGINPFYKLKMDALEARLVDFKATCTLRIDQQWEEINRIKALLIARNNHKESNGK